MRSGLMWDGLFLIAEEANLGALLLAGRYHGVGVVSMVQAPMRKKSWEENIDGGFGEKGTSLGTKMTNSDPTQVFSEPG